MKRPENAQCKWLSELLLLLSFVFLGPGCQSSRTIVIKESPLLLEQTRKSILAVIGEPRSISENGREFYSQYFDKKELAILPDEYPPFRYSTHVSIRGDRRPYDIYVEVWRERKSTDKKYIEDEQDQLLAKRIASKIKQMLNQSRDKRNIIDDFKPY